MGAQMTSALGEKVEYLQDYFLDFLHSVNQCYSKEMLPWKSVENNVTASRVC